MKFLDKAGVSIFCTLLMIFAHSANAVIIAGENFDDDAFVDTLLSSTGSWSTSGGALASVVTDNTFDTWAFSLDSSGYLQLGFTDNVLVNGAGFDLAIFEIGTADNFGISLTIGGTTNVYNTVDTGLNTGGFSVNLAKINLDDFGLAAGAALTEVTVYGNNPPGGTTDNQPTFGLVGALNSRSAAAPAPATIMLLGVALAGLGLTRRK